jgi:rubredoxin
MTDIAMGQVLNTVTCPVCNFSSKNFDPFNLLSIPIPTVADVIFQCTVYRRASSTNCPYVLNKPRKGEKKAHRFRQNSGTTSGPPSDLFVTEEYTIALSRLADSGDLRLQIQNACGIPAHQLRLCRAEIIMTNDKSVVGQHIKVIPLTDKEGPCSSLTKKRQPDDKSPTPVTLIVAFESTLRSRFISTESKDDGELLEDTADEEDELDIDDSHLLPTAREKAQLEMYLGVYGDELECRLVDTNPLTIAKAVSRSLWPRTEEELKLGLRVDAKDHRGNWYPGNVVEIVGDRLNGADPANGESALIKRKVRVHFDNFLSKWDEMYTIEHFIEKKEVRPLYSHAAPRSKPTEFLVHHRYTDKQFNRPIVFGQSFFIQCQNEWSNARAGAHILAQASRFLKLDEPVLNGPNDLDDIKNVDRNSKARRLYDRTQTIISDLIDLLVDCDREYIRLALGVSEHNLEEAKVQAYRNPSFDPTSLSSALVKKVANLLLRLPFEVRVCTVDTNNADNLGTNADEIPFPFSLIRTIGNYMNARHAVILHWRDSPVDKRGEFVRAYLDAPVMYVSPRIEIDKASANILMKLNAEGENDTSSSKPGSAGIDLGVCLTEFCKVQNLTIADSWRCPHCKGYREGRQSMTLWRLPDLMTFHIKRFNMSARWREKITTKVNFPLTGLDLSEWCHEESPTIQVESSDAHIYDLIGVVNHYGSMTGGHYVATCKATPCGRDGTEEVGYSFNGVGAAILEQEDNISSVWRLGRPKAETNPTKVAATVASQAASESAEPLWLQFDDELVEPIPPQCVVSEMAYVLFYRRRRMTPSNIAKYCALA